MDLAKLDHQHLPINGGLLNWLLCLKGIDPISWEVLTVNEPVLRKAMNTLEFLSQDAEARRLYEMRQQALHDEISMIEGAREEGLQKGREQGSHQRAVEIAKKMLTKGVGVEEISDYSGLTVEEVVRLKAH
jgi:predicted transposase/invertase (TIGR01784 family)